MQILWTKPKQPQTKTRHHIPRTMRTSEEEKEMKPETEQKLKRYNEHFERTGIPTCWYCERNMKKIEDQSSEYHSTWKFDCKCIEKYPNLKDMRLNIG